MAIDGPNYTPFIVLIGSVFEDLAHSLQRHTTEAVHWRVLNCTHIEDALALPARPVPDLIVLQDLGSDQPLEAIFEHAKANWPSGFFLLVTRRSRQELGGLFLRYGDMALADPDPVALSQAVSEEAATLSRGSLHGLSLTGLLQMMEGEHKSLAIRVQAGQRWGRLHLYRGVLVDAYVHQGPLNGEQAAYTILSWDKVTMTIERSYRNMNRVIEQSLTALLMEAMRRKDEQNSAETVGSAGFLLDAPTEDHLLPFRSDQAQFQAAPWSANAVSVSSLPVPVADRVEASATQTIDLASVQAALAQLLQTIDGAVAAALVDYSTGLALDQAGTGINLELAAAGNSEVVRAKLRTMRALGIEGGIEDILITLDQQYHLIKLMPAQPFFLYLVLDRAQATLAMARYTLGEIAETLG